MLKRLSHSLQQVAAVRRRVSVDDVVDDVLVVAGIGLVAGGAALVYLPAGLIVAGLLVLVIALGGLRAR